MFSVGEEKTEALRRDLVELEGNDVQGVGDLAASDQWAGYIRLSVDPESSVVVLTADLKECCDPVSFVLAEAYCLEPESLLVAPVGLEDFARPVEELGLGLHCVTCALFERLERARQFDTLDREVPRPLRSLACLDMILNIGHTSYRHIAHLDKALQYTVSRHKYHKRCWDPTHA